MNLLEIANTMLVTCIDKLKTLKNHPRVFMFGGMTLGAAGTVVACAQTYKHIDNILDTTKQKMEAANESENPGKEKAKAVGYFAGQIAKTYALPVAMIAVGDISIGYGNHLHEEIEKNLSQTIAEKAEEAAMWAAGYAALKDRFEEKLGKEEADDIRLGATETGEKVEVVDENGKKKKEPVKEIDKLTGLEASPLAKFFDESSRCWEDDAEYNLSFLLRIQKEQQFLLDNNYVDMVTWGDILQIIDIPRKTADLKAAWLPGDTIDLGLYDKPRWATRRFVNGYESVVLLDPNCRPDVSDYIDKK